MLVCTTNSATDRHDGTQKNGTEPNANAYTGLWQGSTFLKWRWPPLIRRTYMPFSLFCGKKRKKKEKTYVQWNYRLTSCTSGAVWRLQSHCVSYVCSSKTDVSPVYNLWWCVYFLICRCGSNSSQRWRERETTCLSPDSILFSTWEWDFSWRSSLLSAIRCTTTSPGRRCTTFHSLTKATFLGFLNGERHARKK